MPEVFGNTTGLAPSALKALERIYRRRVPLDRIATPELVRSLAEASRETGRQVGALVHRSGDVDTVVVGSPTGLMLPDIGRLRAARGRFRALRLVHTHLFNEPLTRDDLVDLTRLRLDLVAAVLLIIALILGHIGYRVLMRGVPPVPSESIDSIQRDLRAIKGIGKRGTP